MSSISEMFIPSKDASALTERLSEHVRRRKTARLHSTVSYEELTTGTQRRVTLVNPRDADAGAGRISVLSPIGRALLGHKAGRVIDVALPMGRQLSVRVIDVAAREANPVDEPTYAYA